MADTEEKKEVQTFLNNKKLRAFFITLVLMVLIIAFFLIMIAQSR